ncbi:hypothetical protein C7475_102300 [Chitinophaga sp. S165]|nr:hypothetical protein C7475_102300 [Chitinophaga sp. S165]
MGGQNMQIAAQFINSTDYYSFLTGSPHFTVH